MATLALIDENDGGISPSPKRVRIDLRSAVSVGMEMQKVYRMARSGALPVDHASKLMHMLAVISRQHTETTLEARVTALEGARQ